MQVTCNPLQVQFLEISTQSTLPNLMFSAAISLPASPGTDSPDGMHPQTSLPAAQWGHRGQDGVS